jgi:DNA-binding CsgD family transcriptional regulator
MNDLTPREGQIVVLMARDKDTRETCKTLHICESAVLHHVTDMYRKFSIHTRAGLIAYLVATGLLYWDKEIKNYNFRLSVAKEVLNDPT